MDKEYLSGKELIETCALQINFIWNLLPKAINYALLLKSARTSFD